MILVIKSFYKATEKQQCNKGEKFDFGEDENKRIVNLGYAEFVKKQTKQRKQSIKIK